MIGHFINRQEAEKKLIDEEFTNSSENTFVNKNKTEVAIIYEYSDLSCSILFGGISN